MKREQGRPLRTAAGGDLVAQQGEDVAEDLPAGLGLARPRIDRQHGEPAGADCFLQAARGLQIR